MTQNMKDVFYWLYTCVLPVLLLFMTAIGFVWLFTACAHTQPPYEPPTKEERGFAGISTPFKEQAKEEK